MRASVDIPYKVLKEAVDRIEKKKGVCKKLPSIRFMLHEAPLFGGTPNEWFVETLVCDQMGGKSTGVSAQWCKNCIILSTKQSEEVKG